MTAASTTKAKASGITQALKRVSKKDHRLRNRELWLLLFALLTSTIAISLVQLGAVGEFTGLEFAYIGVLAFLVLTLHIVLRFRLPQADPIVMPLATFLTGLGIAEIYRIDLAREVTGWSSTSIRQLVWAAIGIGAALVVIFLLRNYRVLFRYTYLFGLAAIALLLLPLVPGLGADAGADVWISIGIFSFQPSEIAKIFLAIFFAGYLVRTRESLSIAGKKFLGISWPRARDIGPLLVMWLVSMGIIFFQRDLGTGMLMFGLFIAMLYAATGRTSWVVLGISLVAVGVYAAAQILPYVQLRFFNWIHAFDPEVMNPDRLGGSYQLVQGIFGLAQGGLIGSGLGQGRPYLTPLAQSDYIFASLGEELGLIGVFVILCVYMILVSRGFRIGVAGQDDFGKLLSVGLAFTIALQVFIIIGGVTRVIPLTGLTTPFLAAGGSSLVANWIIVALFLIISDSVRTKAKAVIG